MIRILTGDCRNVLKTLPDESVHCVVTSPPYWGLRDYGTAIWEGGDVGCEHRQDARKPADWSTSGLQRNKRTPELSAGTIALVNHQQEPHFRNECGNCGAVRIDSQIGLEPTYQAYIDTMVAVFREVRRVLRKDGTLWLNLGDSYCHTVKGGGSVFDNGRTDGRQSYEGDKVRGRTKTSTLIDDLKPKDLCGIPWRVAFALQADGWWLRQDIIWSKPNPMPESVTDRCTKAHEYIFLLSKSERYYYDAEAIKTKSANPGAIYGTGPKSLSRGSATGANIKPTGNAVDGGFVVNPLMANKRSVWEIATAPFSEAHFATFPQALIEPCVLAGCPKGGTVLDPFGGAGTTGLVADRLGRNAILIELNPEYAAIAERRIKGDAPLFAQVETQQAAE